MLYVLGLISAFASFWFIVAALQTFEPAGPARPFNVAAAVVTALLAAFFFWAGRRWKLLLALVAGAGLATALATGPGQPAWAAGEQIVVSTDPPLSQIHPHGGPSAGASPSKLIVELKDASGRTIPNVQFEVELATPPTNWFISTDVPRIEGKTVLQWSGVAPGGRQEFDYLFPIRGDYRLTIKASPAPGSSAAFTPISRDLTLHISEKPMSFVYLGLFVGALFLFGMISGLVLGRAHLAARAPTLAGAAS